MAPKQKAAPKEEPKPEEPKPEEEEVKVEDAEMADADAAQEAGEEKPKEKEKPKELEEDAPADTRPKVKADSVAVNMADATLNVLPTAGGKLLMTLTEGGLQYLLAGARSTVGVKSGRYMFEVKIVESLNPNEAQGATQRMPHPRNLVRVGFSLAGSSLLLGDGQDNVCFDSEGFFVHEKARKRCSTKFVRGQTVAIVLNLDAGSPNKNTVSLFRNGVRVAQPQPLPENLCGKVLYPTVTYKNVTLQVAFGPSALCPLPFACRPLADAAQADVELTKVAEPKACEVVMPMGLPDMGFFDWVDIFHEKNPGYVELSSRKILDWAQKSGLWRQNKAHGGHDSNDRPEFRLGVPSLDDQISVRKVLYAIAPMLKRNFVVPELAANMVPSDRKEVLQKFGVQGFKKKAVVLMGKPPAEYKAKVQELMLADKKAKAAAAARQKAQEEERQRLYAERKKKAQEAKKAKMAAQKKKAGEEAEEEAAEEEVKEEEEEVKEEVKEEKDEKPEEVAVELSEEEKSMDYRKTPVPDLAERALAKAYSNFALPTKDEGFDDISFAWEKEAACAKFLKDWVMDKKRTQRVEDLKPGESFKEEHLKWQKSLSEWRKRCGEWKDPAKRKALLARKKEGAEAKAKEAGEEAAAEAAEPMEIDMENLDVFGVQDIMDLGNGEPLFGNFVYEDWTLLSTRYELHLMLHSFKKDLNDPDRPGFTETHLGFYYQKYYKKTFNVKNFGIESFAECVAEFIKDSVLINETTGFLEPALAEDTPIENFVKLTEEHRRERQRRIDAGDETAKLKFTRPAQPDGGPSGKGKGKGKGKLGPLPSRGSAPPGPGPRRDDGYGARQEYGQKRPYPARPPTSYAPPSYAPPSYPPAKMQRTTYGGGPPPYSGGKGGAGSRGGPGGRPGGYGPPSGGYGGYPRR